MTGRRLSDREIPFASNAPDERASAFLPMPDGRYLLKAAHLGMVFEADRLRWDRQELRCELTVRCELGGAAVHEGILTSGSFNMSYLGARRDQARYVAGRAKVSESDVSAVLDELCQRVLSAERVGKPAVLLHTLPRPTPDDVLDVDGLVLPSRHPSILFGDGGCGKSYIALLVLGVLAKRGHHVMYADWELDGQDHRDRLERLFGADMPHIHHVRCERPISAEADRLRRLVAQHRVEYAVFDSVAFACDGAPESAEVAAGYFRAVRQLGPLGSLHLAHVTKPGNDPKADRGEHKPFGSAFWHNSARSTWFVKRTEPGSDIDSRVVVGLYNRKSNLGALRPPVGLELLFGEQTTSVSRTEISDVAELAKSLPIWRRMKAALTSGPMTAEAVADEIDEKPDSVRRIASRMDGTFTRLDASDGRKLIALVTRRAS